MTNDNEARQRLRRIETRLTQFMIAMGVDTKAQRPQFAHPGNGELAATVRIPSPHSSLKEITDSLPDGFSGPVKVLMGDECIAKLDYTS
jgi:hypothetical protein